MLARTMKTIASMLLFMSAFAFFNSAHAVDAINGNLFGYQDDDLYPSKGVSVTGGILLSESAPFVAPA